MGSRRASILYIGKTKSENLGQSKSMKYSSTFLFSFTKQAFLKLFSWFLEICQTTHFRFFQRDFLCTLPSSYPRNNHSYMAWLSHRSLWGHLQENDISHVVWFVYSKNHGAETNPLVGKGSCWGSSFSERQ